MSLCVVQYPDMLWCRRTARCMLLILPASTLECSQMSGSSRNHLFASVHHVMTQLPAMLQPQDRLAYLDQTAEDLHAFCDLGSEEMVVGFRDVEIQ